MTDKTSWIYINNPNHKPIDLVTEDLKKILSNNVDITEKGELLSCLLRTSTTDILLPRIKSIIYDDVDLSKT
jgi:hypothetical protein